MEVVNQFNYPGLLFNFNGNFFFYTKQCAAQGNKAMFSISSKMKDLNSYVETQFNVFDTYVKSLISFGAEIWGFHKGQDGRKSAYTFLKEGVLVVSKKYMQQYSTL